MFVLFTCYVLDNSSSLWLEVFNFEGKVCFQRNFSHCQSFCHKDVIIVQFIRYCHIFFKQYIRKWKKHTMTRRCNAKDQACSRYGCTVALRRVCISPAKNRSYGRQRFSKPRKLRSNLCTHHKNWLGRKVGHLELSWPLARFVAISEFFSTDFHLWGDCIF